MRGVILFYALFRFFMGEVFKIIAVAVTVAVLCYYLKSTRSELFVPALVAGGVVLLFYAGAYVVSAIEIFSSVTDNLDINSELIASVLKIGAVCYLIEFACSLIEDFGIKSLADKLLFAGKIIVLCLSAPIIKKMIETLVSFLELI